MRHLLEDHNPSTPLLATINASIATAALKLEAGTAVDATLVVAPSSTKNSMGAPVPEMHLTKTGNQWLSE